MLDNSYIDRPFAVRTLDGVLKNRYSVEVQAIAACAQANQQAIDLDILARYVVSTEAE